MSAAGCRLIWVLDVQPSRVIWPTLIQTLFRDVPSACVQGQRASVLCCCDRCCQYRHLTVISTPTLPLMPPQSMLVWLLELLVGSISVTVVGGTAGEVVLVEEGSLLRLGVKPAAEHRT
jgi:hypothetical protein